MNMNILFVVAVALFAASVHCGKNDGAYDPQFEYQNDVLGRLIRLEFAMEQIEEALGAGKEQIEQLLGQHKESYDIISNLNISMYTAKFGNLGSGSTYIRWGRSECDGDATVVYKGFMGGALSSSTGSGTNYLCLTKKPTWGTYDDTAATYNAKIYGVEYKFASVTDDDAACVVCRIPRSNVLMTPGTKECEDGWSLEYWGYLAAQSDSYNKAKEYICVDQEPEGLEAGKGSQTGGLLYFVEGKCGSLACPPYVESRELTCSVCSYGKQRG